MVVADRTDPRKVWTVTPEGCWEWAKAKQSGGYGVFRRHAKNYYAHRWSYEQAFGVIPDRLVIDHLCGNRACINPEHLEAVSNEENLRRYRDSVTHCRRGHLLTEDNKTYPPSHKGAFLCRKCSKLRRKRAKPSQPSIKGNLIWWAIMFRDEARCGYCGADAQTVDHVVPGGGNAPNNLVACCRSCNSRKGRNVWETEELAEPHDACWQFAREMRRRFRTAPRGQVVSLVRGSPV